MTWLAWTLIGWLGLNAALVLALSLTPQQGDGG